MRLRTKAPFLVIARGWFETKRRGTIETIKQLYDNKVLELENRIKTLEDKL